MLRRVNAGDLKFVERQLPVGIKCLKDTLIGLENGVPHQELEHLLDDIKHFVLDLVKHPLVKLARSQDSGIFQINEVA